MIVVDAPVGIAIIAASEARQGAPLVVGSEVPTGTPGVPLGWSALDRSTASALYLAHAAGTLRVFDLGRSLVFLPAPPDRVWLVVGDSWGPGGDMRVRQVGPQGPSRGPSHARAAGTDARRGTGRPRASGG